jgi:hypothetical protein
MAAKDSFIFKTKKSFGHKGRIENNTLETGMGKEAGFLAFLRFAQGQALAVRSLLSGTESPAGYEAF